MLKRRDVFKGMFATALSLGLVFNANADGGNNIDNSVAYGVIDVREAISRSQNSVVLHVGDKYDYVAIESIKYAIERKGFEVQIYAGGPEHMVTSYVFGHNFPGRHYKVADAYLLENEFSELSRLRNLALSDNMGP